MYVGTYINFNLYQFLPTDIFALRYGRYKAYFISVTGVMIFGILSALATKFWMFAIMRFMQGFCDMVYGLAFTIGEFY